jgi:dicarboxylate transporter 10
VTYGTTRIAVYEELKHQALSGEVRLTTPVLVLIASTSGFIGAVAGTPSDIANIRMQKDRLLAPEVRRNYRNVLDAWGQMYATQGLRAFSNGLWLNCFRCAVMTSSQLASYDAFKNLLVRSLGLRSDDPLTHFSASVLASLVATTLCSPMDVIRTRMMSSATGGSLGMVLGGLARAEGYSWVFRGWTPSFARLGPQTVATLVLLEQHRRIYRLIKGYEDA